MKSKMARAQRARCKRLPTDALHWQCEHQYCHCSSQLARQHSLHRGALPRPIRRLTTPTLRPLPVISRRPQRTTLRSLQQSSVAHLLKPKMQNRRDGRKRLKAIDDNTKYVSLSLYQICTHSGLQEFIYYAYTTHTLSRGFCIIGLCRQLVQFSDNGI